MGSPAVVNLPSPISGAVDEDKARALAKLLLVTAVEEKLLTHLTLSRELEN